MIGPTKEVVVGDGQGGGLGVSSLWGAKGGQGGKERKNKKEQNN